MRKSKISLLAMLALAFAIQSCAPPAQQVTVQVVTVVVTAAPSATLVSSPTSIQAATEIPTATPTSSPTAAPSPTNAPTPMPTFTATVAVVKSPPPPALPAVSNLPAQGPKGGDIDFEVMMSSSYLMRIKAKKHGSANDGDGIDHVLFIVNNKNGTKVYSRSEGTAKFCIFMGGEPDCNPWPKSNGRYVWGTGGSEIVSGDYQVTIRSALKSDPTNESQWTFQITIKLP
jgi:hypothetical protein